MNIVGTTLLVDTTFPFNPIQYNTLYSHRIMRPDQHKQKRSADYKRNLAAKGRTPPSTVAAGQQARKGLVHLVILGRVDRH